MLLEEPLFTIHKQLVAAMGELLPDDPLDPAEGSIEPLLIKAYTNASSFLSKYHGEILADETKRKGIEVAKELEMDLFWLKQFCSKHENVLQRIHDMLLHICRVLSENPFMEFTTAAIDKPNLVLVTAQLLDEKMEHSQQCLPKFLHTLRSVRWDRAGIAELKVSKQQVVSSGQSMGVVLSQLVVLIDFIGEWCQDVETTVLNFKHVHFPGRVDGKKTKNNLLRRVLGKRKR